MLSSPKTPPPTFTATLSVEDPASHRRTRSLQTSLFPALSQNNNTPWQTFTAGDIPPKIPIIFSPSDEKLKKSSLTDVPLNEVVDTRPPDVSCTRIFIYTAFVISAVCVFIFLGRDYIRYVLLSLERANVWTSLLIFTLLFTAVSFPMTWGYILLNVAVGYLYGALSGIPIVITCAMFGIFIAHHVIRRCFRDFVWDRLANETMRSIVKVVESGSGMKVIALARLTPIPFGLQNALFAISNIPVHRYMMASMLGMLPCQGVHVYIGSTLRSMEEVVSANRSSSLAYCIFAAQLVMAVVLLVFVLGKARAEFDKTLEEVKVIRDPNPGLIQGVSVNPTSQKYDDLTCDGLTLHRKPNSHSH